MFSLLVYCPSTFGFIFATAARVLDTNEADKVTSHNAALAHTR